MTPEEATVNDYIYCQDCKMFVDYWKYDHNIQCAGHAICNWRFVTHKELIICVKDYLENGCFDEEML